MWDRPIWVGFAASSESHNWCSRSTLVTRRQSQRVYTEHWDSTKITPVQILRYRVWVKAIGIIKMQPSYRRAKLCVFLMDACFVVQDQKNASSGNWEAAIRAWLASPRSASGYVVKVNAKRFAFFRVIYSSTHRQVLIFERSFRKPTYTDCFYIQMEAGSSRVPICIWRCWCLNGAESLPCQRRGLRDKT